MAVAATEAPKINTIRSGLIAAVALVVALAAFGGALWELVLRWAYQEEYSHGFLIPVVAAWLLWTRRDALRASIGQPSWAGALVILLAMAMHVVGELSAIYILSQLAFVLALIGVTLGLGGYSLFRVAFIPIVFLLFAIPMPYFLDALLSFQLQLISSELGAYVIRLFQIPVYLDGNIIDLGFYKLQVVDACSGLRYLYPLLSLGFLAAYLFQAPFWQRALVFLSTIPITIAMNSLRIGIVGVTVNYWGSQAADEFLHFFEGWIIFLACSGILALEIYVLARLSGRGFFEAFYVPKVAASVPQHAPAKSGGQTPLAVSLALLCAAGLAVFFVSGRSEAIPDRSRFVTFPDRIGQWQGHASLLEPEIERGLALDDYILSDYKGPAGPPINLYVAYYSSQRKGESPHSPIVCIPAAGWQVTRLERKAFGPGFPFNRVIIERDSAKELVYYWFDERGRKIASEWLAKWYLLKDAILMNRTDGALVRLMTPLQPGETERDADERLQAFMGDAVPTLSGYLPSEGIAQVKSVRNGYIINPL
jgi:exosortase D (VPLPA-CTERM-specific)